MASAVIPPASDNKDATSPRLSISLDVPPSSSPFPSPSSSFLPPPMPSAHEFANKPPPPSRLANKDRDKARRSHGLDLTSPGATAATADEGEATKQDPASAPAATTATATATPTSTTVPAPAPANAPVTWVEPATPIHPTAQSARPSPSLAIERRESLMSTRPAPPSPAPSRRGSAALKDGVSSRPASAALSLSRSSSSAAGPPRSRPASSVLAHAPLTEEPAAAAASAPAKPRRRLPVVLVRDFGFPADDERAGGRGPDVPRANRRHQKRPAASGSSPSPRPLSQTYSDTSSCDEEEEEEEEEEEDADGGGGWGGWSFGFGAGGGGRTAAGWFGARGGGAPPGGPSQQELDRNFSAGSSPHSSDSPLFDDSDDSDAGAGAGGADGEAGGELAPGLYRALYAFEPEGTAEMALEEDQEVRVVGRGSGVGWAVAERPAAQGGGHALVPEGYLELISLDA